MTEYVVEMFYDYQDDSEDWEAFHTCTNISEAIHMYDCFIKVLAKGMHVRLRKITSKTLLTSRK